MFLRSIVLACFVTAGLPTTILAQISLQEAFKTYFRIGAALNPGHFRETDTVGSALVKQHFNSITPENDMKWERIHPRPDAGPAGYSFEAADKYGVRRNGMPSSGIA
jgi:endo-1,4-beta-xylanase